MSTLLVALRWDGPRLTQTQLLERAGAAVQHVAIVFEHVDQLDIKALANEGEQFVQLVINTSANPLECTRMEQILKSRFGPKPWYRFW
jgi:hypothetical protein